MGSPGNEAKRSSKRDKKKRLYANCSVSWRMLVPVATGPRVRSGWPRQGQQAPSILVCPQGLSRKEQDSSVSIVPGEGFHMLGGGAESTE